jgi:hypothetical protein
MALATRRLPGIRIDVSPPASAETLPRMDVAVFVGFASTGPLHVPVVVESVAQYAAVFGPDAPLAWDESRGETVLAHLGPTVRAFFSNGGSRCWVIRVARSATSEAVRRRVDASALIGAKGIATTNTFSIPGVLSLPAGAGDIAAARAEAICEGSWSDGLRVSSALSVRSFSIDSYAPDASSPSMRFTFRTRIGLRASDLIDVSDTSDANRYAIVDGVRASSDPGGAYDVSATMCAAFERLVAVGSPVFVLAGDATVSGFPTPVRATLFPAPDAEMASRMHFESPVTSTLERGQWARWTDGADVVWLRMDEIAREAAFEGSPPEMSSTSILATVTGPAWRELGAAPPMGVGAIRQGHVLSLDLRVGSNDRDFRLSGVGLTPLHVAAWWNLSNDVALYAPSSSLGASRSTRVIAGDVPRFPLAPTMGDTERAWLPLGVEPVFGAALAPEPARFTALERDGLADFGGELFLDPELGNTPVQTLPELSDNIRFIRDDARPLLGIHAALSIGAGGLFNEASLLAIPDAVHLGWYPRPLADVHVPRPTPMDAPPQWRTHRGACVASDSTPLTGPDFGEFLDCDTRALKTPSLDGPDAPVAPGSYLLSWDDAEPGGEYVVLEATQDDFSDAREIYRGSDVQFVAFTEREGVYFYRVVVNVGDERSDGSNVIAVTVRTNDWLQRRPADADATLEGEWLAVHRAALRLAGASGELFVVLSMPRHFRTEQALRYAQRLRAVRQPPGEADAAALGFTEARSLSYGALYFPWLQASAGAAARTPRLVPADGVATGVLAARARQRGAWVAPANEPLKDVVALTPLIPQGDWQVLQDAQVNLLRSDPRGLFALSADTLSLEEDVRPINVRRLMTLLRRMALRKGSNYVFEPNGPTLRRAVQRSFGELLTDMFRRGAFAGATAAQSFRVVTDDTINSTYDNDQGRFFVELRVAPAVPMRFLSVRLTQSGERLTVIEEL